MEDNDLRPLLPHFDDLDGAFARRDDPETSHAAATVLKRSGRLAHLQQIVIDTLRTRPMTIWEASSYAGVEIQTLSPRFAPLADQGLIRPTGDVRPNPVSGRRAIVWECTPPGEEAAAMASRRLGVQRGRPSFDFAQHLRRQRDFSKRTFGPGRRTAGVVEHIRKELDEIERDPSDVSEWIDVVILGLDGAWRAGFTPDQIIAALVAKQDVNESRTWPDWRTVPADRAIEHDRSEDAER